MSTVFLLLTSAFLHALWNALLKQSSQKRPLLVGMATVGALASGVASLGTGWGNVESWVSYGIGAGVFEGLYFLALARSFEKSDLGRAYLVMRGGSLVLVWGISSLWLGEPVGVRQLIGVGLVLAGLVCVRPNWRLKKAHRKIVATDLWIAASAICIAGYHIAYGVALAHSAPSVALFCISMCIAVPVVALGTWGWRVFEPRHSVRVRFIRSAVASEIALAGIVATGSFWLFLAALAQTPAGQAMTLRTTSVIFAQFFAAVLGEKISTIQWLGAFLVAAGAGVIG